MRRSEPLDPMVERELAVLDDPSGPVAPDLAELAELARAVRAQRPAPEEAFAARLDAWAASGFAAESSPTGRRAARFPRLRGPALSRRALLPALGAAASLVLVVAVAVSLVPDEEPMAPPRPLSGPAGGPAAGAVEERAAPSLAMPAPPGDDAVAPGRPRRVERQASLVLAAPHDEVADVSDRLVRVTDEVGGIVASSSVSSGERDGGATFELRVPTRRLEDALARLSRLAHVRSRTQSSLDVTGSFVTARERLDEALTERRALLRQLAAANSANETASLRERLRIVRGQIRAGRASLSRVRLRTDYSRVSVSVQSDARGGIVGNGRWTPGDAARDALRVLEVLAAVALVTVAVLAPIALLGGAAMLAGRALRRRRREQALSAS